MTTHRVAELTGALLDAAVAKAEGLRFVVGTNRAGDMPLAYVFTERRTDEYPDGQPFIYDPSQSWGRGGTIIERERIAIYFADEAHGWQAGFELTPDRETSMHMRCWEEAPTPLVAAMRSFVTRKLGETIDL